MCLKVIDRLGFPVRAERVDKVTASDRRDRDGDGLAREMSNHEYQNDGRDCTRDPKNAASFGFDLGLNRHSMRNSLYKKKAENPLYQMLCGAKWIQFRYECDSTLYR